jgi:hypothetical protein
MFVGVGVGTHMLGSGKPNFTLTFPRLFDYELLHENYFGANIGVTNESMTLGEERYYKKITEENIADKIKMV